ncbi:MAG: hypothetical protein AUJ07_01610 [Crenarchaeota archaeon 13_1_40CM_3_53_5]|nr:MAG: hypothetical protein AUJ07_01610 [Crenarchaeota archaeon 13_1_40CM_3_53_5]
MLVPFDEPQTVECVDGFEKGKISIIMPAYNEASVIANSIRNVKKMFHSLGMDYEIIVVDDGSTDATGLIIEDLNDRGVKLVHYSTNKGKGHAFKAGFQEATGEFTFLIDSDSEIRPRNLASFIRALRTADIAIGSKKHPASRVRTPAVRKILSASVRVLVKMCIGIKSSDSQAGFKSARSSSVYRIIPLMSVKRYAFDVEFLTIASLLGLRVVELPIEIELNVIASPKRILRTLVDILGITYRLRLRRWYQKNIIDMSNTYKPIIDWR